MVLGLLPHVLHVSSNTSIELSQEGLDETGELLEVELVRCEVKLVYSLVQSLNKHFSTNQSWFQECGFSLDLSTTLVLPSIKGAGLVLDRCELWDDVVY
jgi:hypothetical protein